MNTKILAICDLEKNYAWRLHEYLQSRKIPYQLQIFTQPKKFIQFIKAHTIEILIMAQSFYQTEMDEMPLKNLYILKEDGEIERKDSIIINKYQSAENILRQIIIHYSENNQSFFTKQTDKGHIIGIYSPVKRCMQTSFSILLGQLLSSRYKVLYINLEGYSGFQCLTGRVFPNDLSDLLYTLKHTEDKLLIRLSSLVENAGGLDFIPPTASVRDLEEIDGEDIQKLLAKIAKKAHYDYIIIDLSDFLRGLFAILENCEKIYTIAPQDGIAMAKMEQYETILSQCGYEEIQNKTKKCILPEIKYLPSKIEELQQSELADYIKKIIKEDFENVI